MARFRIGMRQAVDFNGYRELRDLKVSITQRLADLSYPAKLDSAQRELVFSAMAFAD